MTADVTMPVSYTGKEIQVWVFFRNTKETLACNSAYLGTYTLILNLHPEGWGFFMVASAPLSHLVF
ncbi:MAG TPA: hypothetical protein DCQ50_09435 [Chryseobacterium sp.]|nr:hypothetical protein [Chryseobacterium sp.]